MSVVLVQAVFYLLYFFIVHVVPILAITGFIVYKFTNNKVIKFSILSTYCSIVRKIAFIINIFKPKWAEKLRDHAFNLLKPYEEVKLKEEYEKVKE